MHTTSILAKIREEIQAQLDVPRIRYEAACGEESLVLGGRVLGLEEAVRLIDIYTGVDQ